MPNYADLNWTDPINRLEPLNNGIVARLKVVSGVTGGPVLFDLAYGNNGTLTNGPTWSGDAPLGGHGSIAFTGASNHVLVQSSSVLRPNYITMHASVRLQAGGMKKTILTKVGPAFGTFSYLFETLVSDVANAAFSTTTGTYIDVQSNTAQTVGSWHHLTATWDGTTPKLYLDGDDDTGATSGGGSGVIAHDANALYIGDRPDLDGLEGNISEILIFNRALPANEVAELYEDLNRGSPRTLSWMNRRAYVFTAVGGGGGVTATPSTVSLALTSYAPTVLTPRTVTPPTASLSLTGFAPTVATPRVVTPGIAELGLSSLAPTIVFGALVTPGIAELALGTFTPTVLTPRAVTPPTATLTITPFAPTVLAPRVVTPGLAELEITAFAPSVVLGTLATPGIAELVLETFAPTVSVTAHITCTPTTLALVLATFAPTVSAIDSSGILSQRPLIIRAIPRTSARQRRSMFLASKMALNRSGSNPQTSIVSSSAEVNLNYSTGEVIEVSGTTTISSFSPAVGVNERRRLRFLASLTLTHSSTLLKLPGSANITTAAGDHAEIVYRGDSLWELLTYTRGGVRPLAGSILQANVRLTATSGVPVTVTDVTSETIYATPFLGNVLPIWDGTRFQGVQFSELSWPLTQSQTGTTVNGSPTITGLSDTSQLTRGMAVSGTGIAGASTISSIPSATSVVLGSNATANGTVTITFETTGGRPIDIFAVEVSGEVVLRGIRWSSATARLHDISIPSAFYTNTSAINASDYNGIAAGYGLYLGTIVSESSDGEVNDSASFRGVWNMFNRMPRPFKTVVDAASWTYSTAAFSVAGGTDSSGGDPSRSALCYFVRGLNIEPVTATLQAMCSNSTSSNRLVSVAIGLDGLTIPDECMYPLQQADNAGGRKPLISDYIGFPGLGVHYLAWLEKGSGSDTQTWFGSTGLGGGAARYGMIGSVLG